ncbi:MAG: Eco57I restriction-modification methylase domain-containing protein [Promethearchaeota archaeon]
MSSLENFSKDVISLINKISSSWQDIPHIPKEKLAQHFLNRFMFLALLQDNNILNDNPQYLKERASQCTRNIYLQCFKPLFSYLVSPVGIESNEFGKIPHLGKCILQETPIEKKNNLFLSDELVEEVLQFLERWKWQLKDSNQQDADFLVTPTLLQFNFTDPQERMAKGMWYTSPEITRIICQYALLDYLKYQITSKLSIDIQSLADVFKLDEKLVEKVFFDIIIPLKIVDPAVGSGVFLTVMAEILTDLWIEYVKFFQQKGSKNVKKRFETLKISQQSPSNYAWIYHKLISSCLFGVDMDEWAVGTCKMVLHLIFISKIKEIDNIPQLPNLESNIRIGNSILSSRSERPNLNITSLHPFSWEMEFPTIFEKGGFDIVIGNPPYRSFYASKKTRQHISEEEKRYLIAVYDFINNKRNLRQRLGTVMFFLEKAVTILKEGGICAYLIDNNIYVEAYQGIRKFLVQNTSLKRIIDDLQVFEAVNSGQVILEFQKLHPSAEHRFSYYDASFRVMSTPFQHWISAQNKYQFEVFDPLILHMLDHANQIELGKLCKVQVGYNTGGHKDFFRNEKNSNAYAFVSGGASVQAYSLVYPSKWQKKTQNYFLVYDPQLVKNVTERARKQNKGLPGFGDKESDFEDEKLFLRQSSSRLIATYDDQQFRSRHNLFIINFKPQIPSIPLSKKSVYLKMILAQLNSDILTYYAIQRRFLLIGKGKIPQITANGVRKLPILLMPRKSTLSFLVDSLLLLKKYKSADIDTFGLINNFLNMSIYEYYLFSSTELLKVAQPLIPTFSQNETIEERYTLIKNTITSVLQHNSIQTIFDRISSHPLAQRILRWKEKSV